MLTYEKALEKLLASIPSPEKVCQPLLASRGQVLAATVKADLDLPPFDKSFVDGYALKSTDVEQVPVELQITGQVAAGSKKLSSVTPGHAVQVMTGAPLPRGADAVQMVEKTRLVKPGVVQILEPLEEGKNVSLRASEIAFGSTALHPGTVIGPAEIGVLATFGRQEVPVYASPSAALFSTGNEVVDVSQTPEFGQIRNSNAHMLSAQCSNLGIDVTVFPVVRDDPEQVRQAIKEGLEYDLSIFSGGVSMGEYDYVPGVLAEEGVSIVFHKASIRPGKPLLLGRKDDRVVFGLPGNPVSAFVTFELFVRPAVRYWMGFPEPHTRSVQAELTESVRQSSGRKFFKPARTTWEEGRFRAEPIQTKGSSDLVGFARTNSLLIIEENTLVVEGGEQVETILLDQWN